MTEFIIASTISRTDDIEPILGWRPGYEKPFARLPATFGFHVIVWDEEHPGYVREIHWHTKELARVSGQVGKIVERRATEEERAAGERQAGAV